jgi:hypothetical protein
MKPASMARCHANIRDQFIKTANGDEQNRERRSNGALRQFERRCLTWVTNDKAQNEHYVSAFGRIATKAPIAWAC